LLYPKPASIHVLTLVSAVHMYSRICH